MQHFNYILRLKNIVIIIEQAIKNVNLFGSLTIFAKREIVINVKVTMSSPN